MSSWSRLVQRHRAAVALMRDLHLEAEDVAELAFQRDPVGVEGLGGVAGAGRRKARAGAGTYLLASNALFDLTNRQAFRDHLARYRLGFGGADHSAGVAHADIALQ